MAGVTQPPVEPIDTVVMLTHPIRSLLWLAGLARAELDDDLIAATFALLDNVRAHERC